MHRPRRSIGPVEDSLASFFSCARQSAYDGYLYSQANMARWAHWGRGQASLTSSSAYESRVTPGAAGDAVRVSALAQKSKFDGLPEVFAKVVEDCWVCPPSPRSTSHPRRSPSTAGHQGYWRAERGLAGARRNRTPDVKPLAGGKNYPPLGPKGPADPGPCQVLLSHRFRSASRPRTLGKQASALPRVRHRAGGLPAWSRTTPRTGGPGPPGQFVHRLAFPGRPIAP